MNQNVNENEFFGAPAGNKGTDNYQTPINTHTSPDNTNGSYRYFDSTRDNLTSNSDATSDVDYKKDLDAIYSKKDVPTPDDIITGIKYELSKMQQKDKGLAKRNVLTNLKKDPHYYSKLNHLNIDDASMEVNPKEQLKKIFTNLSEERRTKKFEVTKPLSEILTKMWNQKMNLKDK